MDDTFGGDPFYTHNESTSTVKTDQKGEGVAPVVIAQILNTEDQGFQMWGMSFGMISCVAIVRSIESASTRITYLLEDHTGQIEAHYWIEEGDTLKSPDVMINNYARVYGAIRKYDGKKTIMIFKMTPITSINAVTTHLLEVLNARYSAEKFSKGLNDFTEDVGASDVGMQQDDLGLRGKFLAVYQVIKSESKKGDVSKYELQRKFSHMSVQELEYVVVIREHGI